MDKTLKKMIIAAQKALQKADYVTKKDIRRSYDPQRRLGAKKIDKLVNVYLPNLLKNGVIKRVRVNKATRKQYSIPEKVKSGEFVYVLPTK